VKTYVSSGFCIVLRFDEPTGFINPNPRNFFTGVVIYVCIYLLIYLYSNRLRKVGKPTGYGTSVDELHVHTKQRQEGLQ
jgi:hypothetical protein